jgi:hypothetical protein
MFPRQDAVTDPAEGRNHRRFDPNHSWRHRFISESREAKGGQGDPRRADRAFGRVA